MRPTNLYRFASVMTGVAAVMAAVLLPVPGHAAFIQYNSRAAFDALGPYVPVDWGVFGPDGTQIVTPDQRTVDGLTIGVGSSQGLLNRADEGASFTGTFAPGDRLLTDANSESDSFIVRFGVPVRGFGTQIDAHFQTGPYTGFIDLYSVSDALLYTANFAGIATMAEDNSAPFVGILSDAANIGYATFSIVQGPPLMPASGALAINRLDVLVASEPGALGLLVPALAGMFWLGRRRFALAS